jgi:hypothetical protein
VLIHAGREIARLVIFKEVKKVEILPNMTTNMALNIQRTEIHNSSLAILATTAASRACEESATAIRQGIKRALTDNPN